MAEFTLPKNSKITRGREWKPEQGKRLRTFKIYRYDPGQRRQPALRSLHHRPRQMRSDGPRRADQDQERDRSDAHLPPLMPGRDLRLVRDEYEKGATAWPAPRAIDGTSRARCRSRRCRTWKWSRILSLSSPTPTRNMRSIQPWLKIGEPGALRASGCKSPEDRAKLDGLYECILCFCCAFRRAVPVTGGTPIVISALLILLQAYRWIIDSRDELTGQRLDQLEDPFRLYRCHAIMNCSNVCPKGLAPGEGISRRKRS